jgi:hypothetical protein
MGKKEIGYSMSVWELEGKSLWQGRTIFLKINYFIAHCMLD